MKKTLTGLLFILAALGAFAEAKIFVLAQSSATPFPANWNPRLSQVITGTVMDKLFDMGYIATGFAVERVTSNPNWTLSLWELGKGFGPAPVFVVHLRWEPAEDNQWRLTKLEIGRLTKDGWEFKEEGNIGEVFTPDRENEESLGQGVGENVLKFF
jgi:hypothetical protein